MLKCVEQNAYIKFGIQSLYYVTCVYFTGFTHNKNMSMYNYALF